MTRFRFFSVVLAILLLTVPAYGWELDLRGEYEWQFNYVSRVGPGDVYGNVEQAQRNATPGISTIGLSGPRGGMVQPEALSVRGSDGSFMLSRLWLYPTIKINPAAQIRAVMSVQGSPNGLYQGGPNWTSTPHYTGWNFESGRSDSFRDGAFVPVFNAIWTTTNLPIGTLEVGRRPFGFGIGWSGFAKYGMADTSVALTVPYGPLSMTAAVVLHDTGIESDPYDTRNVNQTPRTIASSVDRNGMRAWDWYASIVYGDGPLEVGALGRWVYYNRVHAWPQPTGTIRDDMTASFARDFLFAPRVLGDGSSQVVVPIYGDVMLFTMPVYVKYFNGRFFGNFEITPQYIRAQRDGGRVISGRPLAWFAELGAMCGPAKLSLAAMRRSGHDRQGGQLDLVSGTGTNLTVSPVSDTWSSYLIFNGVEDVTKPYFALISYYGTGNDSFAVNTGECTFKDFLAYAGRLDYALASNLNLYATYAYMRRASSSATSWGQYTGGVDVAPIRGSTVPDNNIGQEIDCGFQWQLLDGFKLDSRFCYLKWGKWINWSHSDYSTDVFLTDPANSNVQVRVNPDRSLSPLISWSVSGTWFF